MKKLIPILLLSIIVPLASIAQEEEQLFYYLKVSSVNAQVTCLLNGFPVYELDSEQQVINQVPVNLALIGKDNELRIIVKPLGDNVLIRGDITTYGGGEMVSSDDNKEAVVQFEFGVGEKEIDTIYVFDNERFEFENVLKKAPILEDTERLKDFGVKLLAMIKEQKTEDLLDLMRPKLEDTAESFSVDATIMIENMRTVLNDNIFTQNWENVQREEIIPVSYCDGRVWELKQVGNKPLIYHEEAPGNYTSMEIFIAQIDGELKVVR